MSNLVGGIQLLRVIFKVNGLTLVTLLRIKLTSRIILLIILLKNLVILFSCIRQVEMEEMVVTLLTKARVIMLLLLDVSSLMVSMSTMILLVVL